MTEPRARRRNSTYCDQAIGIDSILIPKGFIFELQFVKVRTRTSVKRGRIDARRRRLLE